jgi:hypothetical protein
VTHDEIEMLVADAERAGLVLAPEADSGRVRVRGRLTPELRKRLLEALPRVRAELVRRTLVADVLGVFSGARVEAVRRLPAPATTSSLFCVRCRHQFQRPADLPPEEVALCPRCGGGQVTQPEPAARNCSFEPEQRELLGPAMRRRSRRV